jgi:hypothetical protein
VLPPSASAPRARHCGHAATAPATRAPLPRARLTSIHVAHGVVSGVADPAAREDRRHALDRRGPPVAAERDGHLQRVGLLADHPAAGLVVQHGDLQRQQRRHSRRTRVAGAEQVAGRGGGGGVSRTRSARARGMSGARRVDTRHIRAARHAPTRTHTHAHARTSTHTHAHARTRTHTHAPCAPSPQPPALAWPPQSCSAPAGPRWSHFPAGSWVTPCHPGPQGSGTLAPASADR